MQKLKLRESQIVFALKQPEPAPIEENCREIGINQATY